VKLDEKIQRAENDLRSNILFSDQLQFAKTVDEGDRHVRAVAAPALRWLARVALHECGATMVLCGGEADWALAHAARTDPSVLAVLSTDSDFFVCERVNFIPFHHLRFDGGVCRAPLFSTDLTMKLLQLNSIDALIDLSMIAGNDYTRQFELHATYCTDSRQHSTFQCALAFVQQQQQQQQQQQHRTTSTSNSYISCMYSVPALSQLVQKNPSLADAIAETRRFAAFSETPLQPQPAPTANTDSETQILKMIQDGNLSSNCWSMLKSQLLFSGVSFEEIDKRIPSAGRRNKWK
jgi:hypothetical protein